MYLLRTSSVLQIYYAVKSTCSPKLTSAYTGRVGKKQDVYVVTLELVPSTRYKRLAPPTRILVEN